jgi:spermidine synthase
LSRLRSYLLRCVSELPRWRLSELTEFLPQLHVLLTRAVQRRPFVYKAHGTLSLHFDFLATQSEMLCHAPNELIVPYTRTMMGFLLFKPDPRRIAAIGLGGGSLPKYCYATLPRSSIIVTEIHAEVLAMRDLFHIPPDDERFEVRCEDGADFVRTACGCLDVLFVDGFDAGGQAQQLCTQAFYDDCHGSLAPDGIAVINLAVEDPNLDSSLARIRRSFVDAIVVESEDCTNRIVFAGKGNGLRVPFEQLCARLGELEKDHPVGLRDTLQRIRLEQHEPLSVLP